MTVLSTLPLRPAPPRLPLVTLALCEDLDQSSCRRIAERLSEALLLRPDRLVVDLSACPFVDSTGVEALVEAHRSARRQGTTLVLHAPGPRVRRVLALTGLTGVFEVEPGDTP